MRTDLTRWLRPLAVTAVGCGLLACRSLPSSGQADQELGLEFTVVGPAQPAERDAARVVSTAVGLAVVGGVMSTPNPCYTLQASLEGKGDSLTLGLTASSRGGFCIQVVGAYEYEARITGLTAGSYSLYVVQSYAGTGWTERVHRLRVSVP